jgi:hypothetical protein
MVGAIFVFPRPPFDGLLPFVTQDVIGIISAWIQKGEWVRFYKGTAGERLA